jgi:hypothetical protein
MTTTITLVGLTSAEAKRLQESLPSDAMTQSVEDADRHQAGEFATATVLLLLGKDLILPFATWLVRHRKNGKVVRQRVHVRNADGTQVDYDWSVELPSDNEPADAAIRFVSDALDDLIK